MYVAIATDIVIRTYVVNVPTKQINVIITTCAKSIIVCQLFPHRLGKVIKGIFKNNLQIIQLRM